MVRIIDGDTFEVEARAGKVTIRLIGVDTPEVSGGAECFGTEATEFLRRLIGAERVVLVYDADRTDRYGRTLAYVWRMRGKVFVNLRLVERGYATVLTVRPNVAYRERLEAAERLARLGQRGLWKDCR